MIVRRTNLEELEKALKTINRDKYEDNLEFRRIEYVSKSRGGGETWRLTLKPKNSRGPGGRISVMGIVWGEGIRHVSAVCWHGHGDFFDALLSINPHAVFNVAGNRKIYVNLHAEVVGNWEDRNIGSIMYPMYYSEACHCGEDGYPAPYREQFDEVMERRLTALATF